MRYLKVVDKSGYTAFPWVRYITQNGGMCGTAVTLTHPPARLLSPGARGRFSKQAWRDLACCVELDLLQYTFHVRRFHRTLAVPGQSSNIILSKTLEFLILFEYS